MLRSKNFRELWERIDLRIILLISALHLIFIVIFDKVTAFAPDEANYIGVFHDLYRPDFSLDGYLGWQEGSINALRIIYLPGKLLEVIGYSDFYAVRILSILYSMLSLYLLLKLTPVRKILGIQIVFWLAGGYLFPSVFVWTSIGLRESFIFFSLTSIFYLLVNPRNMNAKTQFTLLALSSAFLLISKAYLYVLLLISLVTACLILSVLKKKLDRGSLVLISAFLIPMFLFPSISSGIVAEGKRTLEIELISPTPTPTTIPTRGQTLHDLQEQLENNARIEWLSRVTGIKKILESKVKSSHVEIRSNERNENLIQLQAQQSSLREPSSLLAGAFNFLFVPIPFVDNGSFFLNAQSYESFIWYFYYTIFVLLLINVFRGQFILNLSTITSILFLLGFITLSALVEINVGTSVRHRAVVLIGILIMLAICRGKESSCPRYKVSIS